MIPYLTVKALAAASALPRLGPGPSLRNACAAEELQSQGLEREQSLPVKWNCDVMSHSISSALPPCPTADVNECDEDPCDGKGRCVNSYGSYTCQCHSGYSQVITQNRKFCQGEAQPE